MQKQDEHPPEHRHPDQQPPDGNNHHKPMGRGMLYASWILVLLLLTWVFGKWEQNQVNPNQDPLSKTESGVTEVVLKRNKYGHYVTAGTINGRRVIFMLDTGATHVAVPEKLASKLDLERMVRTKVSTANGVADAWLTRIPELTIGDIEFFDLRASIVPGMNHDEKILLGMSALKEIEFSQSGDVLTLRQYR